MATSNTSIRIKRSSLTGTPGNLQSGEFAYSYVSNTLFIGTSDGMAVVNVGGQYYTNQIDQATDSAVGLSIVRRDASGNAAFNNVTANGLFIGTLSGSVIGGSDKLTSPRDFSISGGDITASAVPFDGTANVTLSASLNEVPGLFAGTYGSSTAIPVLTIGANGRVTQVQTTTIATSLAINADTGGPSTIDLVSQTLDIAGGEGLTSTVSGATITLDVDDTVVRSNTAMQMQLIDGDIQISGNLTVLGKQTTVDTTTMNVADPLIYLAANNYSSDLLDIGFVGNYFDGTTQRHAGVFRHAGDKQFYIFDGYEPEPTANTIDPTDASFNLATLHANLTANTANIASLNVDSLGVTGGITAASYYFTNNNASITNDGSSIILTPDNEVDSLAGIRIGGNGFILGPNGARNLALNYNGVGGLVGAYNLNVYSGTNSTAYDNGALVVQGGVGVSGDANFNSNVNIGDQLTAATIVSNGKILAQQSSGTDGGGFSFQNDGGYDSGMFSPSDGEVYFYSNDQQVANFNTDNFTISKNFYLSGLNVANTGNILYFNSTTGEVTSGPMADLRPDAITNGSYTWAVDDVTGALYSTSGTYIGDNSNSVVIGQNVDLTNTNYNRVAIGTNTGNSNQGYGTVAIGENAGTANQNYLSVAIGINAGNSNQDHSSVAVGHGAGYTSQGSNAVAIGNLAGKTNQQSSAVAIGDRAGAGYDGYQGYGAVAIGEYAAASSQGQYAIAIGYHSGNYSGQGSVAIGDYAGQNSISQDSIAIGTYAQQNGSGWAAISMGRFAGQNNQNHQSIAIGSYAGNNNLGYRSVALGHYAASSGSGERAIHIGDQAGLNSPSDGAVGIGYYAGYAAGTNSVALGYGAGWGDGPPLGLAQVAIGAFAAAGGGYDNSIVLNATNDYFNATASGLFIKPVRYTEAQDSTDDGIVFYNQNTGEVRYSYALDGGSF